MDLQLESSDFFRLTSLEKKRCRELRNAGRIFLFFVFFSQAKKNEKKFPAALHPLQPAGVFFLTIKKTKKSIW